MSLTTIARPASSRLELSSHSANHRATFARQAAIAAFGPRAAHHLDGEALADRGPHDALQDADEIVEGREAIARWLALAMSSEGEEAQTAYDTADELRQVLGLEWEDLIGRKAA